jgi:hypothetical protein
MTYAESRTRRIFEGPVGPDRCAQSGNGACSVVVAAPDSASGTREVVIAAMAAALLIMQVCRNRPATAECT